MQSKQPYPGGMCRVGWGQGYVSVVVAERGILWVIGATGQ